MKKLISLLLVLVLAFSFAACSNSDSSVVSSEEAEAKKIDGTLEEIMTQIIDTVDVDDEVKEYVLGRLMFLEADADSEEYYLGKAGLNYTESYIGEPMMSSVAFSMVLVRVENPEEAETIAAEIKANVNPNKWICVGVEEDQVQTAYVNDVVFLIMAENADKYIEAFNALAK